jgi:hypothetical protein
MTNTMTRIEVSKLLSEAQEKINDILACDTSADLTPGDLEVIAEWQEDVKHIFTELTDEVSWVMQGKPMITSH